MVEDACSSSTYGTIAFVYLGIGVGVLIAVANVSLVVYVWRYQKQSQTRKQILFYSLMILAAEIFYIGANLVHLNG